MVAHYAIIDDTHNVWVSGYNYDGQLGVGDYNNRDIPVKLSDLPPIISTSTGFLHTLFLDHDGHIWISGCMRHDSEKSEIRPACIEDIQNIVKISSGGYHCLLLDNDGIVFGLGSNDYGELCIGDNQTITKIPTKIDGLPKIQEISCGTFHSLLIDIDGNCWSFGMNKTGQLGIGDKIDRNVPTKIGGLPWIRSASGAYGHSILIDVDDNIWSFGSNIYFELGFDENLKESNIPIQIQGLPKIKSAYCGEMHVIFIDLNGNIWGFGSNIYGELGKGNEIEKMLPTLLNLDIDVRSVICFEFQTLFIDSQGRCFKCGGNSFQTPNDPKYIEGPKAMVPKHRKYTRTKNARN